MVGLRGLDVESHSFKDTLRNYGLLCLEKILGKYMGMEGFRSRSIWPWVDRSCRAVVSLDSKRTSIFFVVLLLGRIYEI